MWLQAFLLHLNSRRATGLFMACFGAGTLSIWLDLFTPWTPAFIVFCYGAVLLYAAKVYLISHSEFTNNSPYFLAFLLFLVSLFFAFRTYSPGQDEGIIVRALGSALLMTIIGLPFRQLLFAYSPGQRDDDTFFSALEQELRYNAVQFKKSQQELVALVAEFIDTRKVIFAQEEEASKLYVAQLLASVKIFGEASDNYPKLVAGAVHDLNKSLTKIRAKLSQLAENAEAVDSLTFSTATGHVRDFGTASQEGAAAVKAVATALQTVNAVAATLPADVAAPLKQLAKDVNDTATQIRNTVAGTLSTFTKGMESSEGELRDRVILVKQDVEMIDEIIGQVVNLLENRLVALKGQKHAV